MSPVSIKTENEINLIREGGRKLGEVLRAVAAAVKPGITTGELNALAEKLIRAAGGEPSFLGYKGYPASLCTSVNEEVVHAIPGERILRQGDIIGLDIGMRYQGFCTDTAVTVPVGVIDQETTKLLSVTKEALNRGIAQVRAGARLGDIGAAIQRIIEKNGFGVVRDLVGHGIGKEVHEEPQIPNYGKEGMGMVLQEGMVICLEPMVTRGNYEVTLEPDGWTVITKDGSKSAHFEHTIAVLSSGFEILTK
ncbi:MAG: type I methionyl aminopeptidase [Candidatus Abawacabacteria bacterium RIFCSPHIGHO2_01_FULL_46_8]|uniref:Methionine aminopeptidase n=1 Tax=Candidatus Abawacabacteria bacterium RIFCSPHIGHO2_01_FULL_46_8 TaxID=1817815 RepID=A0A1F4XMT8_9BACT|nr:MAG: type I methionyl aminopeptidase [Candidatus Abawacabacteria bacterium RIFCSPHIGHO2_01_FULL_46_8]